MWVRTQDKRILVNIIRFNVKNIYGGDKKAAICGEYEKKSLFGDNYIILGKYNTMDNAIEELNEIEKHITHKSNEVYSMK